VKRSKSRGLTLLEVCIAIVILFFTVTALFGFFTNTYRIELRSKDKTNAIKLAQKMMEEQIYADPVDILDHNYIEVPGDKQFEYKIKTKGLNFTDPDFPGCTYRMKEIILTVRGPLDDNGQPMGRTQYSTMKVWRAGAPTSIERGAGAGLDLVCGGIN
jgi:hypothetical protein